MRNLRRFLRALGGALRLVLRGQGLQPPAMRYPNLTRWRAQGVQLLAEAEQIMASAGFDEAAQRALTLQIDRRSVTMFVILGVMRHNLTLEYPMLLAATIEHNLTTLYALNLNDQYRLGVLVEELADQPVAQASIRRLHEHVMAIPPSTQP